MPSAGVNGDESQNLNSDRVSDFDVSFPIEQAEEGVFFYGVFLRGCLDCYRTESSAFKLQSKFVRSSHKKCN